MKLTKKDWIFLFVVALYSYLFYQHPPGLNLLLFNGALIIIQLLLRKNSQFTLPLVICLLGTIGTAIAAVVINSTLAVTANLVSFIVFTGYCTLSRASFFIAFITAVYSILASSFVYVFDYLHSDKQALTPSKGSSRLKLYRLASIGIPVAFTLVFIMLYADANPAFAGLIQRLQFDFLSFTWIKFTFIGGFFLFGIIYHTSLDGLLQWDLNTSNHIVRTRNQPATAVHNLLLKYEFRTGIILLLLLNLVILCFNIFDINLLLGGRLPEGYTYSEYVHQGVNTLITSIILAILIILYFFRANLNFYSKNKSLVWLAYCWIIQNIILVAGILYKNKAYIIEYGLTYKRIGVYVYLALVLLGLLTTIYKIRHCTNHWHLLRVNSWLVYVVLVISSGFNWDALITTFNFNLEERPDYDYLISLSDANLPLLMAHEQRLTPSQRERLEGKKTHFLETMNGKSWQSWNYRDEMISDYIHNEND